ncbi:uncharacterized protein LOC128547087 [Mercenaria mercenaria]|uniref:uncharacterized protein LOC128547087 n=1 Tax=Mercenaria mercenaria TaxID=6596 RepID=UPI00234E9D25|nr:uncharacterized protein LOC128547087 [Mercenaria mercenaria]
MHVYLGVVIMRGILRCPAFSFTFLIGIRIYVAMARNGLGFHNSGFDNMEFNDVYLMKENQATKTDIQCCLLCMETITCMSSFFSKIKQKCRLHGSAVLDKNNGQESEGWKHYIYGENCPVHLGFIHDLENNLCVRISDVELKIDEGKQFCMNRSSTLITLESADKQTRFDNLLAKIPDSFIIARYRTELEKLDGKWKWLNGSPLVNDRWHSGEPNCAGPCSCGGVTVLITNGKWGDNSDRCKNQKAHSVCEAF